MFKEVMMEESLIMLLKLTKVKIKGLFSKFINYLSTIFTTLCEVNMILQSWSNIVDMFQSFLLSFPEAPQGESQGNTQRRCHAK